MGQRGPKPLPTALHKLSGSFRADRHAIRSEPVVDVAAPVAPTHLTLAAREEWDRLVPMMVEAGLLTHLDRATLAGYCVSWARWVEAEAAIAKDGAVIPTASGYPMANPWVAIGNKALDNVGRLAAVLGLSPSARTRIDGNPATKSNSDVIADYFARGAG